MENYSFIRRAVFKLPLVVHSIEAYGYEHVEYFEIVRPLIKEYRVLFNDWVAAFDKWDNKTDPWELLKPPGVGPADILGGCVLFW